TGGAVAARLRAIGAGTISAPVDATNHVLWDIGQPLHAFDLDMLAKGVDGFPTIVVRRARAGEKLVTLDGVTRALPPQLRAGNRSRGDARRSRPRRPPDPRGMRRHAVSGHDRRPRTAGEPACT